MSYTKFQNLNLSDDFLFAKVMEDETVLRPVVEKILGIRIREMTIVQSQRMIEIEPDSKGIRLDIMADDVEGSRYSIEMQNENEYNIGTVSYTHLDVYKRQPQTTPGSMKKPALRRAETPDLSSFPFS